MREDCNKQSNGTKLIPLFLLESSLVLPDVLHMKLRTVNRLIDGLLVECEENEAESGFSKLTDMGHTTPSSVSTFTRPRCNTKRPEWLSDFVP